MHFLVDLVAIFQMHVHLDKCWRRRADNEIDLYHASLSKIAQKLVILIMCVQNEPQIREFNLLYIIRILGFWLVVS